jgi:hypothetical protein
MGVSFICKHFVLNIIRSYEKYVARPSARRNVCNQSSCTVSVILVQYQQNVSRTPQYPIL